MDEKEFTVEDLREYRKIIEQAEIGDEELKELKIQKQKEKDLYIEKLRLAEKKMEDDRRFCEEPELNRIYRIYNRESDIKYLSEQRQRILEKLDIETDETKMEELNKEFRQISYVIRREKKRLEEMNSDSVENTIQFKIKSACMVAGITQTELAERLGQSQSNFSKRIKTGKFSQEELYRMAVILGCRYVYYFEFPNGKRV